MTGYALAIISSMFFSLYLAPRKLSSLSPLPFSFLMSIGFACAASLLYGIRFVTGHGEPLKPELAWCILAGMIWASSFLLLTRAIDLAGLASANQWKNLQGPIGVTLSLVILGEWRHTNPSLALFAGLLVFGSAMCFNISTSHEQKQQKAAGARTAALAGLGFGTVTVINKYVTTEIGVFSQQMVIALSVMATLGIACGISRQRPPTKLNRQTALGLTAGLLYLGASTFMLLSYQHLPAAIAFTIIQLNTLWTLIIALGVFREISVVENKQRLLFGIMLAAAGAATLVLANA